MLSKQSAKCLIGAVFGVSLVVEGAVPGASAARLGPVPSGHSVAGITGHDLVSIGDSFTAAYGVGKDVGGPDPQCQQSDSSVGRSIARGGRYFVTDVSCWNATAKDMVSGQVMDQDDGSKIRLKPQIDVLNSSTDVVLVSAGGNDLGFADILNNCIALSGKGPVAGTRSASCSLDYNKGGKDQLASRLTETVKPALDALYQRIRERAPHAKKFAFTYPDLLPDPANTPEDGCYQATNKGKYQVDVPLTDVDVVYLHKVQVQLNALIREESAKYDFAVLDVSKGSESRTACATSRQHWVNGITALGAEKRDGDAFHPTRLGIFQYVKTFMEAKG